MILKNILQKHKLLYSIGTDILHNISYKNNFYHIPPCDYQRFVHKQAQLIKEFVRESDMLCDEWCRNKDDIHDLRIGQPNKSNNTNLDK